ncbi:MAG TPA: MFS transporter [Acidimicrobiales bacterium]|nr:MFS transporter [Acidimicrobiales bacterium]
MNWLRNRVSAATLGAVAFPLMVLFFVYFFDEFDTAAFNVLAPQIKRAFHLSNQGFTGVLAVNLAVVLAAAVPIGYYGDRLPRRTMVVVGAIVAGVFSLATGLAFGLLLLVLFRIGNGVGVTVNSSVHPSLLADYYTPEARPTTYAFWNNATRWGAVFGPALAGIIAVLSTWRVAFMVLIVPVVVMAIVALRLPDVIRGQSDDPGAAEIASQERPLPFARAIRIVTSVRTLRWQFAAWVAIGAGYLPLAAYSSIYLDNIFHVNSLGIGFISAGDALVALVGVEMSGRVTARWLGRGLGEPLKLSGYALVAVAPFILIDAVAPNLWVAVASFLGGSFVGGWFWPPFLTTQSIVSPARVRTLSFSLGSIFLVAGFITFVIVFGQVANNNIRDGFGALVPFWILGGLILRGGNRYVADDAHRAVAILETTARLRQERLTATRHSILSVRGIDVSYGPVQVLFGVDLDLAEGEIVALLGTNGAGKSTLLRAISGIVPIHAGAIFFDGEDITGLEPEESFGLGLVQVPGGKGVFPGLTVAENLEVAVWASGRSRTDASASRDEALEIFPSLPRRYNQPAAVLSGGEQQMLTLAQAFISRPKLLMIDELSLGLAPVVVEELLKIVRRIHSEGTSVVLVEQSVNVALTVADRAVFMEKGEVRFEGPTADLLARDDILRAVFLAGAQSLQGAGQ